MTERPGTVYMRRYRAKVRAATGLPFQRSWYVRRRDLLWQAKDRPCMDCGVKYPPYVMDFDHRDPSTKRRSVGQLLGKPEVLLAEIAKCDLVCANCHRIRTWHQKQVTGTSPRNKPSKALPHLATQSNSAEVRHG